MAFRILLLLFPLTACKGDPIATDSGNGENGEDTQIPVNTRIDGILNEFLSSNDATNMDESGEYDDWLEIANPTGEPLDLSGYGLTDGLAADEAPWIIPNGTVVLPGNFLLIWCDEDEDQGSFHASFKLSADGETVSLINPDGELVDKSSFRRCPPIPRGRVPTVVNGEKRLPPPSNPIPEVRMRHFLSKSLGGLRRCSHSRTHLAVH